MNVLAVRAADLFDANPYLWLEVLGQRRQELFGYVRSRLAGAGAPQAEDEAALAGGTAERPLLADRFWAGEEDPDLIMAHASGPAAPDALLRALGPIKLPPGADRVRMLVSDPSLGSPDHGPWSVAREQPLSDVLRRYFLHVGQAARALADGEQLPVHVAEELPGKPIPTGVRLAAEIETAVRQAESLLDLDELHALCPTAAAIPAPHHRAYLADAFPDLPPDLVVLAHRHVGRRGVVLAGAAFRHVVSFAEWRRQGLSHTADWARALPLAGCQPPPTFTVDGREYRGPATRAQPGPGPSVDPVWALLRPEVGDECWLVVTDAEQPVLEVRLVRRSERVGPGLAAADMLAAAALRQHMEELGLARLTEEEAVAVLLGARCYLGEKSPGAVWLLPAVAPGLAYDEQAIQLGERPGLRKWGSMSAREWVPTFGRSSYRYWVPQKDTDWPWFAAWLAQQGASRQQVETAAGSAEAWCRHWGEPQGGSGRVPAVAAFLDFLWNVLPLQAASRRRTPEQVTAGLQQWFAFLSERHPRLRSAFADHMAACELTAAYAHRQRTAPQGPRPSQAEFTAWLAEGYQWIGPDGYFSML